MAVSAWSGIIRAFGSPVYSMLATVLGAVINLILDPVAILWLQWGTKGAAITTILGQFASFIMCLVYFLKLKSLKGKRGLIKPDWSLIGKMARLGISSFIIQISIVIVMAVANRLINVYGPASDYGADIPLAVIGIVMKVFGIVIAFGVGIAVGGQPIIGYNYGAKNYKRVNKTIAWILGLNFGVGLIAMALFELVPQQIIDIFGSNEGDLYNQYAQLCFRIYLSGIALTCLQKAGSIILQSLGKSVESTLLSISRDVVFFVPGLIILAQHYGVTGMLYAAPISDVLSLILTMVLVGVQMNKMKGLGKTETVTADIKKAF
jgi:Na+-driven multidrug efflux pump